MADNKKDDKKINNLDDFFKDMGSKHSKDLNSAFKYYDDFTKEENQLDLANNIFNPAQDKMYQSIVKHMDDTFQDDKAKVKGKSKDLKKAFTSGMKSYFETARPSVLKAIEGMDEIEQYEYLAQWYDDHVGADGQNIPSIKAIVDRHSKNNKSTVAHIKNDLYGMKSTYASSGLNSLTNKLVQHHFSKFHETEIAGHLKPKIEKQGIEIDDKLKYGKHGLGQLITIHEGLKKGELKGGYEAYGLKKKEDKKEDKGYSNAA